MKLQVILKLFSGPIIKNELPWRDYNGLSNFAVLPTVTPKAASFSS